MPRQCRVGAFRKHKLNGFDRHYGWLQSFRTQTIPGKIKLSSKYHAGGTTSPAAFTWQPGHVVERGQKCADDHTDVRIRSGNIDDWDTTALYKVLAGLENSPLERVHSGLYDYAAEKAAGTLTYDQLVSKVSLSEVKAHLIQCQCQNASITPVASPSDSSTTGRVS